MKINQIIELSMTLDHEKFHKVFKHVYSKIGTMENRGDEYIDRSLGEKGITVIYRDSQYKKKIKLAVNVGQLLNGNEPDSNRIVRKLNKHISKYFDFKYTIEDFFLSGMRLVTDINVGSSGNVQAYLQVFRRIGKVKGFSSARYDCLEDIDSFCLDGHSNGIEFMIYDLEELYRKKINEDGIDWKKAKEMIRDSEGILRAEVWLIKPKAVHAYTDSEDVSMQITELSKECQNIFLNSFMRILPFGNFYKKGKAEEIIQQEIKDIKLRRKMLRLLALIPKKKSLYLAQKAMNCRDIERVMRAFTKMSVSPVTISKRQDIRYLENIYKHMML